VENLAAATPEELIAIIEALMARVTELEEENRRLRGGKGGGTALAVKPSRPEREQKERKHRGRAFVRRKERRRLEKLAAQLARPYAKNPDASQRVLAHRILKHLPELFVFVTDATLRSSFAT